MLLVFLETLYSNSKSNSIQQHSTHHIDRHRCSGPGSGHDGLEYNDRGSGQFDMKTLITAHWLTGGRGRGAVGQGGVIICFCISIPVSLNSITKFPRNNKF